MPAQYSQARWNGQLFGGEYECATASGVSCRPIFAAAMPVVAPRMAPAKISESQWCPRREGQ